MALGNTTNQSTFQKVSLKYNNLPENICIIQVICGGGHTFILTNDNVVYSVGQNSNG